MNIKYFDKIIVANRGEIAIRVMRTCRAMGIATVAVYSEADADAPHVRFADEAVCIGPAPAALSYLNGAAILQAAQRTGAQALHPGFGFLSENADFARVCAEAGVVFIGPNPEAIAAMGLKIEAKKRAAAFGAPLVPGYDGADQSAETLIARAREIGTPLLIKASAGGGGKGMRVVRDESELPVAIESARREAAAAFGDDTLFIEKYFESARHVEFQILGDKHGNLIHCYERECSVQRRYQKIIEESPSPALDDDLRARMAEAALAVGRSVNYDNAGTVEFILDENKNFYFLEVNTRLQVEHPVTEELLGIDLVRLQIESAMGLPLKIRQSDLTPRGYVIECRVYAENPEQNFAPVTGKILTWLPQADLRYDSGVESGTEISPFYDPMLAKVIAKGETRAEAIQKMRYGLRKLILSGLKNNICFLEWILARPEFLSGDYGTRFIGANLSEYSEKLDDDKIFNLLSVATAYLYLERKEKPRPFSHVPNGWRNNFYVPQSQSLFYNEQYYKIDYTVEKDKILNLVIDNKNGLLEIISLENGFLTCNFNGVRARFQLVKEAENIWIHAPNGERACFAEVSRFPHVEQTVGAGEYRASVPGQVAKVFVQAGESVKIGTPLLVLLSMKMENVVHAHSAGVVKEIFVAEGALVNAKTQLLIVETH